MINLRLPAIGLVLFLSCSHLQAQDTVPLNEPDLKKPLLFEQLPSRIAIEASTIQSILAMQPGASVSISMGKTNLEGSIISSTLKYNNIRSVIVRSSNFNGATLTLSSSTQTNGTVKLTGRLLSMQHGDLYELQRVNEQYFLIKKNFYDVINE